MNFDNHRITKLGMTSLGLLLLCALGCGDDTAPGGGAVQDAGSDADAAVVAAEAGGPQPGIVAGRWDLLIYFPGDDDSEGSRFELMQDGSTVNGHYCSSDWVCDSTELNGSFEDPALQLSFAFEDVTGSLNATLRADGGSFSGTMTVSNLPGEGMVTGCSVSAGCTFTNCTLHACECACP